MAAALSAMLCSPLLQAVGEPAVLSVRHDHFIGSGQGQLTIDKEGIAYDSEDDEEHLRSWSYTDIQQVKIESPTQLEILSYEDVGWKFGRDRRFEFQIIDGRITPELVRLLRRRLPAAVVSAVFSEPQDVFYTSPAKHRHRLGGGCDGELFFDERGIYYVSSNRNHSRFWPLDAIESLGRQSDFSFRITVREQNLLGETRNFQFQLKRPLDKEAYELFWRKIYEPESWLNRVEPEKTNSFSAKGIRFDQTHS